MAAVASGVGVGGGADPTAHSPSRDRSDAVFVVDGDRTVREAWVSTEWPEFPPYDNLEAAIEAL